MVTWLKHGYLVKAQCMGGLKHSSLCSFFHLPMSSNTNVLTSVENSCRYGEAIIHSHQ